MKRVLPIILLLMFVLAGCGTSESEIGTIAEYEDTKAELLKADFFTTDDGREMIRVYVRYTNDNSNDMYMLESFAVKAYQNEKELVDSTDINDDILSVPLIQSVKNGESLEGTYVFELRDTSSVEVQLCTPTADEISLAKNEYTCE